MKGKTVVQKHKANFETLKRAFKNDDVALMDCIEKATGEHVAVLCMVNRDKDGYSFIPLAKFFNDNPFKEFIPPTAYGDN